MCIVTDEIGKLDCAWQEIMQTGTADAAAKNLDGLLEGQNFHPSICAAFRPFKCLKPSDVKVVIVGQDPYPCYRNATGLAFSLPPDVEIGTLCPGGESKCARFPSNCPSKSQNAQCVQYILQAIQKDIGGVMPSNGNLEYLAKQGVLLMNASFTYPKQTEWHNFSREIIRALSEKHKCLVFMLWGGDAKSVGNHICQNNGHKILCAPHPASRGAHRNRFLNCKHFSAANEFLGHDRQITWLP